MAGSKSVSSKSHDFVQRGGDLLQDPAPSPDPVHLIPCPCGRSPLLPPTPCPPSHAHCCQGPRPLDRGHLFPKERWYWPIWFALLSTEPYKDLPLQFSSETPHPVGQPFPPHLHKSQLEVSRSPERGASSWYGRGRNPSRGPRGSLAEMEENTPGPPHPSPSSAP